MKRKKKFFLSCLCAALAIALFCGVFAVMGWGSLLHQVGGTLVYPFQWAMHGIGNGISGFFSHYGDMDRLQDELESLRAENEELRSQLADAQIVLDESGWLYKYLSMKDEHADYTMCNATVISTVTSQPSGGVYVTRMTLNKGSAHGIEMGMPVVTVSGLVGMVIEVSYDHCKVQTILDTASSVGAITVREKEQGLLEGDFACMYQGYASLNYLEETADITVGDIVVTSGKGSIYPYGIPIGEVVEVSINAFSRTVEATVCPYANLSDTNDVMILTSYDRYAGEVTP